jgi:hypothetical protein
MPIPIWIRQNDADPTESGSTTLNSVIHYSTVQHSTSKEVKHSTWKYGTAQYNQVRLQHSTVQCSTYVCYLAVEVIVVLEPDSAGRLAGVHLAGESLLGAAAVHAQHRPANKKFLSRKNQV